MFRPEHEHLVQVFEEKCFKLQYEDAQLIAEYLCVEYECFEHARILLARVFLFRSNFSAAIAVLKNCKHPIARYFLAVGMYKSGDYQSSINILNSLKPHLLHSDSRSDVRLPCIVTEADISSLLTKARLRLGDQEHSDFTQESSAHGHFTENDFNRPNNIRKRKSLLFEPGNSCSSTQSMAAVMGGVAKGFQFNHEGSTSVWSLRVLKAYNHYGEGNFEEVQSAS